MLFGVKGGGVFYSLIFINDDHEVFSRSQQHWTQILYVSLVKGDI